MIQDLNQTSNQNKNSRIPQISLKNPEKLVLDEALLNPSLSSTTKNSKINSTLNKAYKVSSAKSSCIKTCRNNFFSSPKHNSNNLFSQNSLGQGKTSPKVFEQRSNKTIREARPSTKWEDQKLPLTPTEVLSNFSDSLPSWEQEEIKDYPKVYFIGKSPKAKSAEFDDSEGDYKIQLRDHISFRYEIIRLLGSGSFGQVVEVIDHCLKKKFACKIVKSKKIYNQQAKIEVEMLETIKKHDNEKNSNVIEIISKFMFRNHMVSNI